MEKRRKREVMAKMSKFACTDVSTQTEKRELQKSVERIIRKNQKVFDNLAKN